MNFGTINQIFSLAKASKRKKKCVQHQIDYDEYIMFYNS